jgi:uncharacterized membrane protein YfcA
MLWVLLFLFLIVAVVYASAGFGGGSLYLAILSGAFFPIDLPIMHYKFIALLCNGTVALLGFIKLFQLKDATVPWKQLGIILLCSSPLALLSASLKINNETFLIWLGSGLLLAAIGIVIPLLFQNLKGQLTKAWIYPVSGVFGFLSGITGIGGGVYLAPFLHFTTFAKNKSIATITTAFIAINSFVALFANIPNSHDFNLNLFWLLPVVLVGGYIGNSILRLKMNTNHLKMITAIILIFAGIRLLIR